MNVLRDTRPEIEKRLVEGYRQMSGFEKLRRVASMADTARKLASARILRRYGAQLPERELNLRLASLRLDREIMIRVFDWDPEEHGY